MLVGLYFDVGERTPLNTTSLQPVQEKEDVSGQTTKNSKKIRTIANCISLYDATTVAIQDRARDKVALRAIDNLLQNKLYYYSELS